MRSASPGAAGLHTAAVFRCSLARFFPSAGCSRMAGTRPKDPPAGPAYSLWPAHSQEWRKESPPSLSARLPRPRKIPAHRKMFPFKMWVGLFSTALFMCPLPCRFDYRKICFTPEPSHPPLIPLEGALPAVKRKPFVADGGPKLILSCIAKWAPITDDSCDRTTRDGRETRI